MTTAFYIIEFILLALAGGTIIYCHKDHDEVRGGKK